MILDGYKKANLAESVVCYQIIAGAPNGVYLFLIPMDSLKQLDSGPANDKALAGHGRRGRSATSHKGARATCSRRWSLICTKSVPK